MAESDVELREVTRAYGGRPAVDSVSLEIRRGEFFSLLGPSGGGKTTLLRLIAGFERPDSGRILLGGRDVTADPPQARDLNLVFQNYALFPHLDVFENVAFGLRIQRRPEAEVRDRVTAALALVRLPHAGPRRTPTLSGGEQQRVALARALVTKPRVLLLDEPLAALDRPLRAGMQEELRRLQRETGVTFVLVTHDQDEALSMSDRVAVLRDGRLEQVGLPQELYQSPATRFVAEFVGAGNFFEGTIVGAALRTEDGWSLPVPSASPGPAVLLVRPERLRFGDGPIEAVVTEVLFAGATATYVLQAGRRTLRALGAPGLATSGQAVRVGWDPSAGVVLRP